MTRILVFFLWIFPAYVSAQDTTEDDFQEHVIAKVIGFNAQAKALGEKLAEAKAANNTDSVRLKNLRMEVVQNCFAVPQAFIKNNLSSMFCIQALQMLGDGSSVSSPVKLADLESMYAVLDPSVRESEAGKIYAAKLKSYYWLNKLRLVADDMKSISPKEVLQHLSGSVLTGSSRITKEKSVNTVKLREEKLQEMLKASTLMVNMAYRQAGSAKTEINAASGYVLDESGICVTNYHVLKEYSSKEIYQSLFITTNEGESYPVLKVLGCSESDDLAVLQVDTKGDQLSALPLGATAVPGDEVYVVGHPRVNYAVGVTVQSFYQMTSGKVTENVSATLFGKPCEVMNITAEFTVGSSGGPIVDGSGNVVGTVSRKSEDGKVKTGIPVSELKKLLVLNK